ncbi:ankyrin repeat domain-containing protein [Flavobacterium sp.]|uniref:ankyrin repeat domain-containing protein n=1 Tax=Flavobacterium sp. TaxID=239 RepID=UPI0040476892
MKKIHTLLFVVIGVHFLSAQEEKTIFDIARTGTVIQIEELIEKDPKSVFRVNENGFSALVLATYKGNNDVAKLLIEKGSDINGNSQMGTPLMAAIVKGNNEIAKILIEKKADLDLMDSNGTTALLYAVQFKNHELVSIIVKTGVDIDYKDKNNKSAIDYALLLDDDKLIELLKNKNKKL